MKRTIYDRESSLAWAYFSAIEYLPHLVYLARGALNLNEALMIKQLPAYSVYSEDCSWVCELLNYTKKILV